MSLIIGSLPKLRFHIFLLVWVCSSNEEKAFYLEASNFQFSTTVYVWRVQPCVHCAQLNARIAHLPIAVHLIHA